MGCGDSSGTTEKNDKNSEDSLEESYEEIEDGKVVKKKRKIHRHQHKETDLLTEANNPRHIKKIQKFEEQLLHNIETEQQNYEDSLESYDFDKSKKIPFETEALQYHNKLRKRHFVPPLKISPIISHTAQNFAEYLAEKDYFEHSKNTYDGKNLGENIFCVSGKEPTGEEVTMNWYAESEEYDYKATEEENWRKNTGEFTQIVWKETKLCGFGIAKSKRGRYYCVGNYYPAGNVLTQFADNVIPDYDL